MENRESYQFMTSVREGILEITMSGEVTQESVEKLQDNVFAHIKAKNPKLLLVDLRTLMGRFGITDAYYRVRNYPHDLPRIRTAVVDTKENFEFGRFHETTSLNVGIPTKWFTDIDSARTWLKSNK